MVNYGGGGAAVVSVTPSGDTTGAIDAARINAAIAKLPSNASGGMITLEASATWYVKCGTVISTVSGVWINAPGCYIVAVGTGAVFDMSASDSGFSIIGGGILGWPTIDGVNAGAGSTGVHAGDILQLQVDVYVQNFSGAGSIGVHLDNRNYWTEQARGRIYAKNCTQGVVFDMTGNGVTSTGSFDRMDFACYINQVNPAFDGVVAQGGATLLDGSLGVYGNFVGSASALTSCVLRVTGANSANAAKSVIYNSRIEIGAECDTALAHAPQTIICQSAANVISGCYGILDFSAANSFAVAPAASISAIFPFDGPILGDAGLATSAGFNGLQNIPSGIGIGNYAGAQALSNNSTITLRAGTVRVSETGNVAGVILTAGSIDGQFCWVVNTSAFTVTFAASGTSNVAGGTGVTIPANGSMFFIFDDGVQALWVPVSEPWWKNSAGQVATGLPALLAAGTTSAAPLNFASGTNLTAAAAGAVEFDGTCFYATAAASSRQVVDSEQFACLSGTYTLAANTSAQALFNVPSSGVLTVAGTTTYFFECEADLTSLSASAHTLSFGLATGGGATITSLKYVVDSNTGAAGTLATWNTAVVTSNAATAFTASVTTTTAQFRIRGTLRVNAGGTITPQITQGTNGAAAVVSANSFFRCWPVGSNAVTTVGDWA